MANEEVRSHRSIMRMSPSRRGLAAQLFSLGVIVVIQALQVPIFIACLGTTKYGSFLVLIAIPTALTLADFGLLSATSTRLIGLLENKRQTEATDLSRFTNSFIMIVTSLILLIVAFLTFSIDVSQPQIPLGESRAIVVLYAVYAVLFVYSSSLEAVMRAAGAYSEAWTRLSILRLIDFAVCAVALVWTGSLVVSIVAMLLSRLLGMSNLGLRVRSVAPWASWKFVIPRSQMAKGLLKPTIGSIALPLGNAFVNQGVVLAVNAAFGPVAVVIFTSVRTMVNVLRQLTGAVTNSALPSLTQLLSRNDTVGARRAIKGSAALVSATLLTGGIGLVVLGSWVLELWTHGKVSAPSGLIVAFMLQASIESAWVVLSLWFVAENRHFGYSIVFLLSSVLVVFILFVVPPPSLVIVALTLAASSAVVLIWVGAAFMKETRNERAGLVFQS